MRTPHAPPTHPAHPDRSSTPAELRIPTKPGDLPAIMAAQRTLESLEARELEEALSEGEPGPGGIWRYSPATGRVEWVNTLRDLHSLQLLERKLPWR